MGKRITNKISGLKNLHWRLVIDGLIIGVVAGTFSIFYRFMLSKLSNVTYFLYNGIDSKFIVILSLIIIGFIVGRLLKWEPLSSGSGIPQVEAELIGKVHMNSGRLIISKLLGGGLANIAGLSLGREGPSIQIGAAVSKILAKIMKKDSTEERYMITAGASAGLSAAFNAPISGTIFALEEMHKSFSSLVLIPCLIASVVADFLSKNVFGLNPAFSFKVLDHLPLNQYYNLILLGIFAGLIGVVFNKTLLFSQDIFKSMKIRTEYKTIIIMLIAGLVGYFSFDLLGGGHHLLEDVATSGFPIKILIFFIVGKLLFTTLSYGSGAQGGIFLPILVLGGLVGAIYFTAFDSFIGLSDVYYSNFIIFGMAAIMTAVVRSPIISILLVSEMTGSFAYVLALSIVSIVAYLVAEILNNDPIYHSLLERLLNKEGNKDNDGMEKKTLIKFDMPLMGDLIEKRLDDINWPCKMIVVSIERSGKEIIPSNDEIIEPGDEITVLVDYEDMTCVKEYFGEEERFYSEDIYK